MLQFFLFIGLRRLFVFVACVVGEIMGNIDLFFAVFFILSIVFVACVGEKFGKHRLVLPLMIFIEVSRVVSIQCTMPN